LVISKKAPHDIFDRLIDVFGNNLVKEFISTFKTTKDNIWTKKRKFDREEIGLWKKIRIPRVQVVKEIKQTSVLLKNQLS